MYNGIGLETARGSGTNGFVQRNLSYIKTHKDKIDFKSEEELKKIDAQLTRAPNLEILYHDNKRKIELKCLEMEELMEEQGYTTEEIQKKVSTFRKMLMEKLENSSGKLEFDDQGRLIAKATHQISEANQLLNEQLRMAFGISEYFKEGSSLDPDRKVKEKAAQELALAQKKYSLMKDVDSSSSSSDDEDDVDLNSSDLQTTDEENDNRNYEKRDKDIKESRHESHENIHKSKDIERYNKDKYSKISGNKFNDKYKRNEGKISHRKHDNDSDYERHSHKSHKNLKSEESGQFTDYKKNRDKNRDGDDTQYKNSSRKIHEQRDKYEKSNKVYIDEKDSTKNESKHREKKKYSHRNESSDEENYKDKTKRLNEVERKRKISDSLDHDNSDRYGHSYYKNLGRRGDGYNDYQDKKTHKNNENDEKISRDKEIQRKNDFAENKTEIRSREEISKRKKRESSTSSIEELMKNKYQKELKTEKNRAEKDVGRHHHDSSYDDHVLKRSSKEESVKEGPLSTKEFDKRQHSSIANKNISKTSSSNEIGIKKKYDDGKNKHSEKTNLKNFDENIRSINQSKSGSSNKIKKRHSTDESSSSEENNKSKQKLSQKDSPKSRKRHDTSSNEELNDNVTYDKSVNKQHGTDDDDEKSLSSGVD